MKGLSKDSQTVKEGQQIEPDAPMTQTPGSQPAVCTVPFKSTFYSEHLLPQARSQWSGSGWCYHSFQPPLFFSSQKSEFFVDYVSLMSPTCTAFSNLEKIC